MANIIDILIKAKDDATSVMSNVSKAADKMGMSFDKSVDASKGAAAGITAIAAAGAAFVGFGAKIAGDLEASRAGFITLLGSAEKADAAIALIKKDAAATPFELPGLIAANQLLTSVTKDAVQSEKMLMNVGKALSAMGKGQPELDRIIVNLQQIGAVGKASLMDVRQFAFAGIPIFEMLTEATGKTGEELSNFISDGGVTFEVLEEMFNKAGTAGGRFADAFSNQAGGFNQLWANMSDTVTIAAAEIVQQSGVFDILKNAMKGVIDFVGNNQDTIVEFIKNSFEWIKNNGALVAGVLMGLLAPAIISLVSGFVAGAVALAPWVLLFSALAIGADLLAKKLGGWGVVMENLGRIFDQGRLGVLALIAAFKDGDVTSDGFVGAMEKIGVALRQAWEVAKPVVQFIGQAFVNAFKDLWKVISEQLWPALVRLKPLFIAIAAIVGGVLLVAIGIIIAALYAIVKVVTVVVAVFAGLYNFLADFIQNTGGMFADMVMHITNAWNGIVSVVTTVMNAIGMVVMAYVNTVIGVWQGIVAAAQAAWSWIYNGIIAPYINLITGIIQGIGAVVSYIWQWVVALTAMAWAAIQPIIQPVIAWITGAIKGVGDFISGVWQWVVNSATAAWNGIVAFLAPIIAWFNSVFTGLGNIIIGIWNNVRNGANAAFSWVRDFIGGVANNVRGVWQGISDWFGGMWKSLTAGVSGIGTTISNAFTGAMDGMKNIVKGAVNWVIDKINGMIDAVNGVADKVPGAPKLGRLARLANGTQNWGGGTALVGERGPELINVPKGANVYSATRTANALRQTGGGTTIEISGNIYNQTPEAVDRFFNRLNRIDELTANGVAV